MKKATRFSFVNNKDTALTAPDRVVTIERSERDKDIVDGRKTVGRD